MSTNRNYFEGMAQEGMTELHSKAWRSFHRIGSRLLPHLSRAVTAHSGITGAEYVVLLALSELDAPAVNLNRLAIGLGWETSRMSHQITRMHEVGLVKKIQSETDARSFDISITAAGRKIAAAAIPLQSKEINHCFSEVLTKAQMQTLIEISDAIDAHMREHHPLHKKESK